jgi:hypothetical protein
MLYDIYCPGHLREFTTTGGKYRQSLDFCGGCQKRILKTIQKRLENTVMKLTDPKTWNSPKKYNCAYAQTELFVHPKHEDRAYTHFYLDHVLQPSNSKVSTQVMASLCLTVLVLFSVDSLQAVPLDTLRAPMTAMKNEVWSYMFAIKVGAAIVGAIGSAVQSSLTPLGIGAGIAAGIHFFDGVIGDGSAALIGF